MDRISKLAAGPGITASWWVLAMLAPPAPALASGLHLHEQGTALMGSAHVGQAAIANDAATAYYNPAGMTRLEGNQLVVGAQYIGLSSEFSRSAGTTTAGGNGGDSGVPGGSPGFFYSHSLSPDVKAGISLTAPFGLALEYDRDWAGRYYVQDVALQTINLNPALGYRLNPWLSVGGGVSFAYAHYYARQAINNALDGGPDGVANFDTDDVAMGFNLGVLVEPRPGSRIGFAYRSGVDHGLKGDVTFYNVGPSLRAAGLTGDRLQADLSLPDSAILSVYQEVMPGLAVLGELGWENTSVVEVTVLRFNGGGADVTPRDWHDTYRLGVGLRYEATPLWTLMTGVSYDSSPVRTATRTPDLPNDAQLRLGLGAQYKYADNIVFGAGYTFVDLQEPKSDIMKNGLTGRLVGTYDEYLHFLSLNVSVKF